MILITLTMVVFALLTIISVIDLKTKRVPAFLTTAMIFAILLVNSTEITFGLIHMTFGIFAFVFAYMLYESNFIGGVADIKVLVIIGMMIGSIPEFFGFIGLVMILGMIYKMFWRFILKKHKDAEIPFLPLLWIVYALLWIGGGLI